MILCINANAAVDRTVVVAGFHTGSIHRPESVLVLPGGKGCNVARVIKTLGGESLVTGWAGGYAGQFIEAGLRSEGIAHDFVHIQSESRTCLTIIDPDGGALTEIYEHGTPVSEGEVEALEQKYITLLNRAQLVTLSGSLPPGVRSGFYARLTQLAQERKLPVLLDTSGPALQPALETGGVRLFKVNLEELAILAGCELPDLDAVRRYAVELSMLYGSIVSVTLGSRGALAAWEGQTWLAQPPPVAARSAVGSGDSALAAWALALLNDMPVVEGLRSGVAAGTANTLQLGAGCFQKDDYQSLLERIIIS